MEKELSFGELAAQDLCAGDIVEWQTWNSQDSLWESNYGIIIEILQDRYTEERSMELTDALANTVGALVGVFLIKIRFSGKRQLKW